MTPRPLLLRLTRSYRLTFVLVALCVIGGYGVARLGADIQHEHLARIRLIEHRQLLVAEGLYLSAQLLRTADPAAQALIRHDLDRVATDLEEHEALLVAAERPPSGWWARLLWIAGGDTTPEPAGAVDSAPYQATLRALAASADRRVTPSSPEYQAHLAAYAALAPQLAATSRLSDTILKTDVATMLTRQTLTLVLVLASPGLAALFIFRPLFARLSAEHQELHLLSLVASKTDNGVIITDAFGRTEWANTSFERISGYTLADLRGRTPGSVLQGPETSRATVEAIRQALHAGRPIRTEILNYHKQGHPYWLDLSITPVHNAQGRVTRFIAIEIDITARKDLEGSVRSALKDLSDVTFALHQATIVSVTDSQGHILDANEPFCTITGYRLDELIGQNHRIINAGYHDTDFWDRLWQTISQGQVWRGEICNRARDGRIYWAQTTIVPALNRYGSPARYLAVSFDITEHKNAEARLRFQKTLLECQSEASLDGLLVVSPNRQWLAFNQRFLTIWGLPSMAPSSTARAEALPHIAAQLIDPEQFTARLDELYRQPDAISHEEIRLRDGRTLERYSAPIRSSDGEYFGRFWSYRDITARVVAEAALRGSEATNRALIEAIPDLMFHLRTDGVFLGYQASRSSDLAIPPESFMGRRIAEVFDPALAEQLMAAIGTTVATGSLQRFEYELTVDDELRDFEARITVIGSDEVLVIVRDISERKANDRLKNEFISVVSHELRTPLTAIRGSLGLIAGGVAGDLQPQARAMIDIAYKNSERLVRLINDILDIEKIESGKMQMNRQPLTLAPLIQQTIDSLAAFGTQLGVRFQLEPPPDVQIYADSDLIIQVITNLLSNAAKFSPAGEAVVVRVARHNTGVRISVIDRGPGIPDSFRSRIFQKFAQADSSSTRTRGGTGLGLSIARAIVERHNGQISFESIPGAGATFHVDLPEWRPTPPTDLAAPAGRILVCEGDLHIAQLIAIMLRKAGFAVDVTTSADEARRRLTTRTYIGVTMDIRLPEGSGLALLRELRTVPATRGLPVVVVAAQADHARIELSGEHLEVRDWLSKPIDRKRLIAAFTSAVRGPAAATPRILHVEDDPDVVRVVAGVLADMATIVYASSLADARAWLADDYFDLVLLDFALPDGDGRALLPLLQAQSPPIPAVAFTADAADADRGRVAATLIKSRATNQDLHNVVRNLLAGGSHAQPTPRPYHADRR